MQRLQPEDIEGQVFPTVRRGYDMEKVDAFLRVVGAYYREALRVADQEVQTPTSQTRGFEAIGTHIASILATASAAAEDLTAEADREAQKIRRAAAEEAAVMSIAAANELAVARQVKADAQQDADAVRAEASEEAAKLRRDSRERMARFEQDARARIAELEETAKANVEAFLEEARRRHRELRIAERQAAEHLGSVQATIRKAKESLSGDYTTMQIGDLLGQATESEGDAGGSMYQSDRSIDQTGMPVGYARLRWSDPDQASRPPRSRKKNVYDTSSRDVNRPLRGPAAGSDEPGVAGPGDHLS